MRRAEKGVALLNVLFIATVLSAVLGSLSYRVRHQIGQVQLMQDRLQAELLAESAMADMQFEVLTNRQALQGAPEEMTAWEQEMQALVAPEKPEFNLYGEPFSREQGAVTVTLLDGSNKFNLFNFEANRTAMQQFLEHQGIETEAALTAIDGIADWIDNDSFHHLHGAESEAYPAGSGMPRNGTPEHLLELRNVKGMTEEVWALLGDRIGYFGGDLSRYLLLDREMLLAIMPPEQAEILIAEREGNLVEGSALLEGDWLYLEESMFPGYPSVTLQMLVEARSGDAHARLSLDLVKYFGNQSVSYVYNWKRGTVE